MKPKLVVYGAGVMGSAVATGYRDQGTLSEFDLIGFIDNNKSGSWVGFPILGKEDRLPSLREGGVENIIVAISDHSIRPELCSKLEKAGYSFPTVSPVLPKEVKIGRGCLVDSSAVFLGINQEVGDFCVIGPQAVIEGESKLSMGVYLCPHTFIGAYSQVGEGTVFYPFSGCKPYVRVGKNCVIGPQVFLRKNLEDGKKKLADRR